MLLLRETFRTPRVTLLLQVPLSTSCRIHWYISCTFEGWAETGWGWRKSQLRGENIWKTSSRWFVCLLATKNTDTTAFSSRGMMEKWQLRTPAGNDLSGDGHVSRDKWENGYVRRDNSIDSRLHLPCCWRGLVFTDSERKPCQQWTPCLFVFSRNAKSDERPSAPGLAAKKNHPAITGGRTHVSALSHVSIFRT